jgi:hypothetical protein
MRFGIYSNPNPIHAYEQSMHLGNKSEARPLWGKVKSSRNDTEKKNSEPSAQ